jgi:phage portal protein BeeE
MGDLLTRMLQDADLAGNAYIRMTGDGHLERLRPDWVTIVSQVETDADGRQIRRVIGYLFEPYADPDRESEYLTVDEVAHWAPIPDPCANFRGMSWLTPVIREINTDMQMSDFQQAFYKNAATPQVIIKYQQKLLAGKVDALRTMIAAKHAGAANAFGTLVLDEGADPMIVGANMEGSAFAALQEASEVRISAASGVPALVAGLAQGIRYSQPGDYPQAVRLFADLTMRPLWRSAVAVLAKLTTVPGGAELWYDTGDVSALQPGEQDKAAVSSQQAATINTLIMAGWIPDSVKAAVVAGDMSLLVHSGLVSVQMQPVNEPAGAVAAGVPFDPNADYEVPAPTAAARAVVNNELEHYWTVDPEGLAKWADKPKPWTALYHHLLKYLPDGEAKRTAAQWFHKRFGYWPGSDTNRVVHGHPPRGHKVGPG